MLEPLILRRAVIAEADRLGALALAAWETSMEATAGEDAERDVAALLLAFQLHCIGASEGITVAVGGEGLMGWSGRMPGSSYISDLWVGPGHQRQGVGKGLLAAVEAEIVREGHPVGALETAAVNGGAIRFYLREGYRVVRRGSFHSRMLGRRIDKVRMEKRLGLPGA